MLKVILSLIFITFSFSLNASEYLPDIASKNHSDLKFSAKSEFKFLMWKIYDIYLFKNHHNKNIALKLKYSKDIAKEKIIENSIKLIKRQNFSHQEKLILWEKKLNEIIPNIKKGEILIGIKTEDKTIFYNSFHKLGEINDPEFGLYFFNIWLGTDSIEPQIREDLLQYNE
jgi:hypothetical protein